MAHVLRDAGWSTFWVGKNHNVPVDEWTMGASKKNWPLGQGYDRFYGFIGGETNNWYPDLAEDNHYIDQPYLPEDGLPPVEGPRRPGARVHPRLQAVRAGQALVPVVLPGRQPRAAPRPAGVHRQVQGQVRRRLRGLPRVGAAADDRARHPARGHRADADQPDARGHVHAGRRGAAVGHALRRREAAVLAAWPRSTPASPSTPTPRSAGSSTTSRSPGQLDNTLIFYCADNGASGEGSPNGSVNEGKFFNGYPDDDRGEPGDDRPARRAGHLQPLPDRLGGGVLDAVPDVQALHATRAASATRWSSTGRRASRPRARCATSTTTHRHRPDDPRLCGVEMPDVVNGVEQTPLPGVSMRYSFDAADAPTHEGDAVLRDARHARHLARGLEGGHRARPDQRMGNFDKDRWQLFHTDEDRSEAHDLAEQHPEKLKELRRSGSRRPKKYNVLPLNDLDIASRTSSSRDGVPHPGAAERPVHLLPGHDRGPGALGRQHARRLVQDPRRGRVHRATRRA